MENTVGLHDAAYTCIWFSYKTFLANGDPHWETSLVGRLDLLHALVLQLLRLASEQFQGEL